MRQSTKRKKPSPVPFHQLVLNRGAVVLALRKPRTKSAIKRAVDVAALVREGKIPKEHRKTVGDCVNKIATHIGGIKGNKRLCYRDRAQFYGARDSFKAQDAEDAAKAAAATPAPEMLPPQFEQPQPHARPPIETATTVTAAE